MALQDYTREFGRNLNIAYPIMAGQIAHLLVAFADNVMVGKLGDAQLAAVSLGNTLIFIALSIGIGFSFAITPLVAEADAKGNFQKVKSIFHNGVLVSTINGVLLCILLFLSEPILFFLDQPDEVIVLAIPYMRIVAFSMIPLMIFQSIKQFSDGLSKTVFAMQATIVANIVNIILNYLLIYGEFGFPRLEVEGAAYGTLVARILMVPVLIFLLTRKVELKKYFTLIESFSVSIIKKLLHLGFPTALQMFFEVSLFTAAIILSGVLGTKNQAANQIALNLSAMTFMVGVGLSVTATIRVGNQLGAGNITELKRIARSIFLLTLIFDVFFALMFYSFRAQLPWVYIDDIEVVKIASSLLVVAAFFQVSDGLQVVFLGALRGLQDVWIPSLICFVAYWLIGFPVSYYLGIILDYDGQGIWMGLLLGLSVSSILMYLRYRYLIKLYELE
ncbi:MATE family efflux transporter [Nonlabens arenilitoris]|uniref:Multidrug-efflux transporter n=1 Tax=Nonlabens arenilitoris TaxID=1217969 RepID=A0A2S7U7A5_9FLAO|nr:MATE family efflux transporter [Nonlabens arenilitoris]PQJ30427.1 MATE family efflux transporter [Nonlabens arenilitoris]